MTATLEAPRKARTARKLRWRTSSWGGAVVSFGLGERTVNGPVGAQLLALGASGTLTFVDREPGLDDERLALIRAPDGEGVMVAYYPEHHDTPTYVEHVRMCPPYRKRLGFQRKGSTRWLTIKADA